MQKTTSEKTPLKDGGGQPTGIQVLGGGGAVNVGESGPRVDVAYIEEESAGRKYDDVSASQKPILIQEEANAQSLLICTLNLSKLMIGAGMLSLPWAFAQSNFWPGMIAMIISGLYQCLTAMLVVYVCEKTQTFEYSALLKFITPFWEIVATAITMYVPFSSCIGYGIVGSDFVYLALKDFGFDGLPRQFWVVILCICFYLPLCLLKDLRSLRFSSMLGLVAIFYCTVLLVCHAVGQTDKGIDHLTNSEDWYSWNMNVFIVTNVAAKAFVTHYVIPPMYASLERRSIPRMWIACGTAYFMCFVLYTAFAVAGYIAYGDSVPSDVTNAMPNTVWSIVARLAMAISIITVYPLVYRGLIGAIQRQIFGPNHNPNWNFEVKPWLRPVTITTTVLLAMIVPLVTDNIGIVNSIEGAITVLVLECLVPCMVAYYTGVNFMDMRSHSAMQMDDAAHGHPPPDYGSSIDQSEAAYRRDVVLMKSHPASTGMKVSLGIMLMIGLALGILGVVFAF